MDVIKSRLLKCVDTFKKHIEHPLFKMGAALLLGAAQGLC